MQMGCDLDLSVDLDLDLSVDLVCSTAGEADHLT